jgi:hypothetical protein
MEDIERTLDGVIDDLSGVVEHVKYMKTAMGTVDEADFGNIIRTLGVVLTNVYAIEQDWTELAYDESENVG